MFIDDLSLVGAILRKKRRLKRFLTETSHRFRPGLWLIEGPYARHHSVSLPTSLHDAIRGIRRRRWAREFAERVAPPWLCHLPESESVGSVSRCSIVYFSNGGDWKLFDLESGVVWTHPTFSKKILQGESENVRYFGSYFNIPTCHLVFEDDKPWRCDRYIDCPTLAQCTPSHRIATLRKLMYQYSLLAHTSATPAQPHTTEEAVHAFRDLGLISCATEIRMDELNKLADHLKYVPAHGDLSGQNIFVCKDEPWVIDWDNAGERRPVLHDVLYLVLREAELGRPDLLEGFLRGTFAKEIEVIVQEPGLFQHPKHNVLLLMHNYIIHFYFMKRAGRRDASRQNVQRLWNLLCSTAEECT